MVIENNDTELYNEFLVRMCRRVGFFSKKFSSAVSCVSVPLSFFQKDDMEKVDHMMLLFLACRTDPKGVDTSTVTNDIPESGSVVESSNDTAIGGGIDIDEDGFPEETDCDDWDPAIHPNAEEIFDYIDNNCDGVIDFDGIFRGTIALSAVAIYEGNPYSFAQNCDVVLERDRGFADVMTTCLIDLTQENADILLGEELFCEAESTALHDSQWQTQAVVYSSSGWDTDASLQAMWSPLSEDQGEEVTIQVELQSFSLNLEMLGTLKRE